jgi:long-chain acyl-CoA synthetase
VAGNKVDPLEVEEVLGAHPSVAEVVVIGKPHRAYGEMVKAVVVSACADMPEDPEVLLSFCAERLAEYKIPKVIEFRDEIPRSPLGKILRKYL